MGPRRAPAHKRVKVLALSAARAVLWRPFMRHIALALIVSTTFASGCGIEPDEPAVAERSEALEIIGSPIFIRPRITAISPTSAAPGATVTITGGGFDTLFRGPAAFGSTTSTAARASVTYVSPTQLTVVVPAGAQQGPIYLLSSFGLIGQPLPVQLTSAQIFTPLVVPAAPTNLSATVASSSRVNLAWSDRSWNETGFEVWINDGSWRLLRTVAANATGDAITGLQPSRSYSFRVRAQNATGPSGYSNTVSATTPAALGTVVLTNNAQIGISQVTFNGVARAPTQVNGTQATFSGVPAGATSVLATLVLATGDWVCSFGGNVTVIENQTSSVNVQPLTAGQVLTHCSGSVDYVQGSYVDLAGFHTVSVRVHASGRFDWWLDGVAQAAETITGTTFNEPWLSFTLSGGDTISMGWPFGSMQLWVNNHAVQLTRATGW